MRLVTWNVNGLRSLGPEVETRLKELEADIICMQETKASRDQLEECHSAVLGYTSYFAFSRKRQGYSGVATYCSPASTPVAAEEGLSGTFAGTKPQDSLGCLEGLEEEFTREELRDLDSEGRAVLTLHKLQSGQELVVINVYCPRGDPERPERISFKLRFYKLLEMRANRFIRAQRAVIIVGDVNASHKKIDHCDPDDDFELHPSRKWMDHLLVEPVGAETENADPEVTRDTCYEWETKCSSSVTPHQFVDCFRQLHPNRREAFTCWNTKHNCRQNNFGTRIDYILADVSVAAEALIECDIHPEIVGSDHCPVAAVFHLKLQVPSPAYLATAPPVCASGNQGGRQKKISAFLQKRPNGDISDLKDSKRSKQQRQTKLSSFFSQSANSTGQSSKQALVSVTKSEEVEVSKASFKTEKDIASQQAWKALLRGPRAAPLCPGHRAPAVLKTVSKKGPNCGRQFWSCARGEGKPGDPEARCQFFQWVNKEKKGGT